MVAAQSHTFWLGGIKVSAYFSATLMTFIPKAWKTDGTYTKESWPSDAVLLSSTQAAKFWKQPAPKGFMLGATKEGRPEWTPLPPPAKATAADIESGRLKAYSDPITGSDRLFSEASRMKIMNEAGYEAVLEKAMSRYAEIQSQYPWPNK